MTLASVIHPGIVVESALDLIKMHKSMSRRSASNYVPPSSMESQQLFLLKIFLFDFTACFQLFSPLTLLDVVKSSTLRAKEYYKECLCINLFALALGLLCFVSIS